MYLFAQWLHDRVAAGYALAESVEKPMSAPLAAPAEAVPSIDTSRHANSE